MALPVPPPEPRTDASVDTSDVKSPTTIVLNFLRSKGMPPSGANIRTALEQNAREPGYIPGLGNDAPGTDSGPPVGSKPASGPSGKGSAIPTEVPLDRRGDQTTSAPPPSATGGTGGGGMDTSNIGKMISLGLGIPGAAYVGARGFGALGGSDGSTIDPSMIGADTEKLLTGPPKQLTGPPAPLDLALDKATAPSGSAPPGEPTVSAEQLPTDVGGSARPIPLQSASPRGPITGSIGRPQAEGMRRAAELLRSLRR